MEISNKTIEVLKRAGWYEGRKIDITENLIFLEERGFYVFDSAKSFMEEFGELKITVEEILKDGTKSIAKHSTCIKESVGILDSSFFDLDEYYSCEKVMLIGTLYDHGTDLYISESGRIFDSIGWIGDSTWEAFDNIINEKGTIIWDKFKG